MDDKIVEVVARALHESHEAFPADCWVDYDLTDWGGGNLRATVDGEVNFSALATAALSAARPMIEAAWRDGWHECKARLTDDEVFCLTDDVEEDAWDDSKTAAAIRALGDGGEDG